MKTNPPARIEIHTQDLERMRQHVQACLPEEACGLLGGNAGRVSLVVPTTNALRSPQRFRIEPTEQLVAFQQFETLELELVGIYHSHPEGPDHPSPTDIAEAYYPEAVSVIWHHVQGEWRCRVFIIRDGLVEPIELILLAG